MKNTLFSNDINDSYEIISKYGMLQYLEQFKPEELKYSVFSDKIFYEAKSTKESNHPVYSRTIPFEAFRIIQKYDSIFRMSKLTKESYSYIKENLMLVYGDDEIVNRDIKVFHYTEKKIIHEYLAIPQLDKMFDEDYFNFEWDMHVGQNFNEHRNDYYRDHFVHQVRDMYSMLVLLGRYGIFEGIYDALFDEKNGKITQFTQLKREEFLHKRQDAYIVTRNIYGMVKKQAEELLENLPNTNKEKECIRKRIASKKAYSEAYFKKYVIYASCILSALFHDMGYPICHFLEVRHRISEYNPTMHMFTHNAIDSFDTIASKLGDSLLFTIVSNQEIQSSLQVNKKGRFDHGAYSAIAFLMQFYNNGLIFSLPVEKQCAIELAAVAIYNHTRKYKVMNNRIKSNYYQPVFAQNPISFLLRLCDDLQEWDRRYFEISIKSDILTCDDCLMPLLVRRKETKKEEEKKKEEESRIDYCCACGKGKEEHLNSSRKLSFQKRKMYLVTTSDLMTSELLEAIDADGNPSGKNVLYFRINYDLFRLLNIARINSTYAKFRLRELNDIKKLLKFQAFKSDNGLLEFDQIYIDYFMTSNPVLIKVKILEKYFVSKYLNINTTKYNMPTEILLDKLKECSLSRICKECRISRSTVLYEYLAADNQWAFQFYLDLLELCIKVRSGILDKNDAKSAMETAIIQKYIGIVKDNPMYCDTISELIYDCVYQYSKETVLNNSGTIPEDFILDESDYYKQYEPQDHTGEDVLNYCVNTYCRMQNDFNRYTEFKKTGKAKYIGYYADLTLFERMNETIRKTTFSKRLLK